MKLLERITYVVLGLLFLLWLYDQKEHVLSNVEPLTRAVLIAVVAVALWMAIAASTRLIRGLWRRTKQAGHAAAPHFREAAGIATGVAIDKAQHFLTRNKICPYCRETIKREASICKHCQMTV